MSEREKMKIYSFIVFLFMIFVGLFIGDQFMLFVLTWVVSPIFILSFFLKETPQKSGEQDTTDRPSFLRGEQDADSVTDPPPSPDEK